MNDIAASAERRAEILLKNAELEANLITREAKESISRYADEGNRLKERVETLRDRYKKMLETELERLDFGGSDFLADFEKDFLPASLTEPGEGAHSEEAEEKKAEKQEAPVDLTKTMVNIR